MNNITLLPRTKQLLNLELSRDLLKSSLSAVNKIKDEFLEKTSIFKTEYIAVEKDCKGRIVYIYNIESNEKFEIDNISYLLIQNIKANAEKSINWIDSYILENEYNHKDLLTVNELFDEIENNLISKYSLTLSFIEFFNNCKGIYEKVKKSK